MLLTRPQGYTHHLVVVLHRGQGVTYGLLQATANQDIAYTLFGLKLKIATLRWQHIIHQRGINTFISDDAGQLFGQIGGHLNIEAVPGSYTAQELFTGFYT